MLREANARKRHRGADLHDLMKRQLIRLRKSCPQITMFKRQGCSSIALHHCTWTESPNAPCFYRIFILQLSYRGVIEFRQTELSELEDKSD